MLKRLPSVTTLNQAVFVSHDKTSTSSLLISRNQKNSKQLTPNEYLSALNTKIANKIRIFGVLQKVRTV